MDLVEGGPPPLTEEAVWGGMGMDGGWQGTQEENNAPAEVEETGSPRKLRGKPAGGAREAEETQV